MGRNGTPTNIFFCDVLTIMTKHLAIRENVFQLLLLFFFIPLSKLHCCLSYDDSSRGYLLPVHFEFWLCVSYWVNPNYTARIGGERRGHPDEVCYECNFLPSMPKVTKPDSSISVSLWGQKNRIGNVDLNIRK